MLKNPLIIRPVFDENPLVLSMKNIKANDVRNFAFPNPARSEIYFQFPLGLLSQNVLIRIIDVFGRVVYEGRQVERVDVSSFSRGVYLVSLTDYEANMYYQQKIVLTSE